MKYYQSSIICNNRSIACKLLLLSFAQKNLVASLELGLAGLGVDAVFTLCCDFIQVRDLILIFLHFTITCESSLSNIFVIFLGSGLPHDQTKGSGENGTVIC